MQVVSASDSSPTDVKTTFATVNIRVVDVNNYAPEFVDVTFPGGYDASIDEGVAADSVVYVVEATDRDIGANGRWMGGRLHQCDRWGYSRNKCGSESPRSSMASSWRACDAHLTPNTQNALATAQRNHREPTATV